MPEVRIPDPITEYLDARDNFDRFLAGTNPMERMFEVFELIGYAEVKAAHVANRAGRPDANAHMLEWILRYEEKRSEARDAEQRKLTERGLKASEDTVAAARESARATEKAAYWAAVAAIAALLTVGVTALQLWLSRS